MLTWLVKYFLALCIICCCYLGLKELNNFRTNSKQYCLLLIVLHIIGRKRSSNAHHNSSNHPHQFLLQLQMTYCKQLWNHKFPYSFLLPDDQISFWKYGIFIFSWLAVSPHGRILTKLRIEKLIRNTRNN